MVDSCSNLAPCRERRSAESSARRGLRFCIGSPRWQVKATAPRPRISPLPLSTPAAVSQSGSLVRLDAAAFSKHGLYSRMNVLVTGGCGFIGSNLVKYLRRQRPAWKVVNLDKLTYCGNLENLTDLEDDAGHHFARADIADRGAVQPLLRSHSIDAIVHLAAESHVDRSILGPDVFIHTNVLGTQVLLEACQQTGVKRFLMVSTDEVYGSLGATGRFTESSPLAPSSPYSASKASADLLALAYHRTFGIDVVVTRCSNNYGPYQFPEKLIPLMIVNALHDEPLPVYGDGGNVRDWLHVDDHCDAIDCEKIERELGYTPEHRLEAGLRDTIAWYRANEPWWRAVQSGEY